MTENKKKISTLPPNYIDQAIVAAVAQSLKRRWAGKQRVQAPEDTDRRKKMEGLLERGASTPSEHC